MKTIAPLLPLTKKRGRKNCFFFCWRRYQRSEKACLYSHRLLSSCEHLRGRTRLGNTQGCKIRALLQSICCAQKGTAQCVSVSACMYMWKREKKLQRNRVGEELLMFRKKNGILVFSFFFFLMRSEPQNLSEFELYFLFLKKEQVKM